MSLATRHLAKHAAMRVAASAAPSAKASAKAALRAAATAVRDPEYAALLEQLGNDLRDLSNIQSIERKIDAKRHMIVRYDDWVAGALRAGKDGKAAQDEILVTILVWLLDVQDWTMALQIGAHVLAHGLSLPERYKRTPATVIAEEVADAALKPDGAVPHGVLIATDALTAEHDMPDQVRAKLMKAIGRTLIAEAAAFNPEDEGANAGGKPAIMAAALTALKRALSLDDGAGVKKDIETLERELKKLAPPT